MITLGVLAPKSVNKDPSFGLVSLLLHGNGTNSSTTFVDSSLHNRTITVAGNAKLSTAQAKFGSASMLFDGTGDYAFNDSSTPSDAYTAECWAYPTAAIGDLFNVGNFVRVFIETHSGNWVLKVGSAANNLGGVATLNAWTHIAISTSGGGNGPVRLYIGGVLVANQGGKLSNPDSTFTLAADGTGDRNTGGGKYIGFIDDMRYTIGVARYTSNFTPPVAQYPDS